jgi:hypothetical protein
MRTRVSRRGAAKAIALTIMAAYGWILGRLCGHLWFGLFVAPSPLVLLERGQPWSSAVPVYIASALLGAAALVWLGMGASNGHFGFKHVRAGRNRFHHAASLGATYGAGAGALLSTVVTLSLGFALATKSAAATAPWVTSPHWVVLAEVAYGGWLGALVGAPLGALLVPMSGEPAAAAPPPPRIVYWMLSILVVTGLYALAVHFSRPFDGQARTAVLIAASAGLVYFGCAAAFLHKLLPAFGSDVAVFKRLSARAMRWAIAAGILCGIGTGLRVGLYAVIVGWDPEAQAVWLAALGGALLGTIAGLAIATFVMPRTQS